jgi:hypothetical protein
MKLTNRVNKVCGWWPYPESNFHLNRGWHLLYMVTPWFKVHPVLSNESWPSNNNKNKNKTNF